ncbi:hypothetical protein N5I72_28560, partial [Klebsiella variicola]|uniref:hypothetical protein n=1 Tax=Klebsiella variicola TaxID=244366 RepID=UPI0022471FB7
FSLYAYYSTPIPMNAFSHNKQKSVGSVGSVASKRKGHCFTYIFSKKTEPTLPGFEPTFTALSQHCIQTIERIQ